MRNEDRHRGPPRLLEPPAVAPFRSSPNPNTRAELDALERRSGSLVSHLRRLQQQDRHSGASSSASHGGRSLQRAARGSPFDRRGSAPGSSSARSSDHRKYKCDDCDERFEHRAELKAHTEARHERRRYKCDDCDHTFTTSGTLRRHIAVVHEKKRDFACMHCNQTFTQNHDLRRHIQNVHERIRNHACPVCGSAFSQAWDMRRHFKALHPNDPRLKS